MSKRKLKVNEFQCSLCGGVFIKGRTDEVAMICDVCFTPFKPITPHCMEIDITTVEDTHRHYLDLETNVIRIGESLHEEWERIFNEAEAEEARLTNKKL